MKTIKLFACLLMCVLFMSSCYTSRVLNGDVKKTDPVVEVNKQRNSIMLWGLLPLNSSVQEAGDHVGEKSNYVSETKWTFVDGLLNVITLGIYSPTTTVYYLPIDEVKK